MTWPTQQGIWRGGDLTLPSGAVLTDSLLSWKAHGTLSEAKAVSLRLPEKVLDAVRGAAKRQGVPYQRFIRMAIESALDRGARK